MKLPGIYPAAPPRPSKQSCNRMVDENDPRSAMKASPAERLLVFYTRHFPLDLGKSRLVNATWRLVCGESDQREARLLCGGFRVPCDLNGLLQRQFHFFGTYFFEKDMLRVWAEHARGAKTIFDVGANLGIYSLTAVNANRDVAVHAFEPTPEIAKQLRWIREINKIGNLTVNEAAVSDQDGFAHLVRCDGGGGNDGMNFIGDEPVSGQDRVPTVTLDTYCEQNRINRIDLLKIDVQGLEVKVLEGSIGTIRGGRIGLIFLELNWHDAGDVSPADRVIALLEQYGFHFSRISSRPQWRSAGTWLRRYSDIMARPATEKCRDH